jgi:hypothetical protein
MAISAAAKTQGRHGLSGRRCGSFAGKTQTVVEIDSDSIFTYEPRVPVFTYQPRTTVFAMEDES